jgi:hypothetical protein
MIAENFTEQDEAEAVARIERLLEKRTAQHRYVAQAQAEVVGRQGSLLNLDVELERAKAWLERIYGQTPRRTMTHSEHMALLDDLDRQRTAAYRRVSVHADGA